MQHYLVGEVDIRVGKREKVLKKYEPTKGAARRAYSRGQHPRRLPGGIHTEVLERGEGQRR